MIQGKYLDFNCAADLAMHRFVTITPGTDTVAYTAAAAAPDAVTVGNESNGRISVHILGNLNESFWFDAAGTIAVGDDVEVGADGQGVVQSAGAIACVAKIAAVNGSNGVGYKY